MLLILLILKPTGLPKILQKYIINWIYRERAIKYGIKILDFGPDKNFEAACRYGKIEFLDFEGVGFQAINNGLTWCVFKNYWSIYNLIVKRDIKLRNALGLYKMAICFGRYKMARLIEKQEDVVNNKAEAQSWKGLFDLTYGVMIPEGSEKFYAGMKGEIIFKDYYNYAGLICAGHNSTFIEAHTAHPLESPEVMLYMAYINKNMEIIKFLEVKPSKKIKKYLFYQKIN